MAKGAELLAIPVVAILCVAVDGSPTGMVILGLAALVIFVVAGVFSTKRQAKAEQK